MNWDDLRYLLALAETGTLLAAARRLSVEHATIARRIAGLEQSLAMKLVDRRGKRLILTEDGRRIVAVAMRMEEEAAAVGRIRASTLSEVSAEVTLSVPPAYAASRLVRPLVALRRRHPGLCLRIMAETRYASLNRGEADLAVRLSRPVTGDLTILKLDQMQIRLYATRSYLDETPPADWCFIAYDASMDDVPQQHELYRLLGPRKIGLRASTLEMQLACASAGAGVAMLPDFMARSNGDLVEAMPLEKPVTREIWLAVHNDVKASQAIRIVIAALQEGVAAGRVQDGL